MLPWRQLVPDRIRNQMSLRAEGLTRNEERIRRKTPSGGKTYVFGDHRMKDPFSEEKGIRELVFVRRVEGGCKQLVANRREGTAHDAIPANGRYRGAHA